MCSLYNAYTTRIMCREIENWNVDRKKNNEESKSKFKCTGNADREELHSNSQACYGNAY